ncbi:hypothetical protein KC19_VG012800 [Ceratodon purpureus]|uniref:Uncharacterized protein n=1 Tax=Ceratodon purpureus TaxID=3225 RepID=A0A8T0HKX7_CERPU|nr:hypothetical protein KC19_VG012800 [Ceratodon purpureus]
MTVLYGAVPRRVRCSDIRRLSMPKYSKRSSRDLPFLDFHQSGFDSQAPSMWKLWACSSDSSGCTDTIKACKSNSKLITASKKLLSSSLLSSPCMPPSMFHPLPCV